MSSSVSSELDGLSLHGLMSQGLNVVIAKRLLHIDGRYDQALVSLEEKWQERFDLVEAKLNRQSEKVEALQVELKVTKMALKAARGESTAWKRQAQFICTTVQSQSKTVLADVTEARNVSESCRAQVDKSLTLLKQEFEAIVAHIGRHDTSMAATKLEMERRFHDMAETSQLVHTGFLEQQMEMMSIRNTLRGMDRQTREISPVDQCEVSIFMDQQSAEPIKVDEIERDWVQPVEDTGTFDLKECISVLSIDSYDSLRQELERKMKMSIGTAPVLMVEKHEGEDQRALSGTTMSQDMNLSQDMALRLAQAKNKFETLKARDLTRKDEPSVIVLEPLATLSIERQMSPLQENDTSLEALDENTVKRDDFQARYHVPVTDTIHHSIEEETVSLISFGKKRGKKVTFVTENDEGEDELEYLVFMGEQSIAVDVSP